MIQGAENESEIDWNIIDNKKYFILKINLFIIRTMSNNQ